MKLVSVLVGGQRRAGVLDREHVYVSGIPGLDAALAGDLRVDQAPGRWWAVDEVVFDAPLRPPFLLCTGNNYVDHNDERTRIETERMEFFLKAGQTIAPPAEPVRLNPEFSRKLDQETELGIVIGKAARNIGVEAARQHIFGYVIVNDLTARDLQVRRRSDGMFAMDLGASKNFDGATRLNRSVLTADEVADPHALEIATRVNGQYRQLNNTANMINRIERIVSLFSKVITLQPGTIISTGTPGGTGWGQDATLGGNGRIPARCVAGAYLAAGDRVESCIQGMDDLTFCASGS